MKRKFKAFLSLLLTIIILFSSFPVTALADNKTTLNHFYITTYAYGGAYTVEHLMEEKKISCAAPCVPDNVADILYAYMLDGFTVKNNFDDSYIKIDSKSDITIKLTLNDGNDEVIPKIDINTSGINLYNYGGTYKHYTGTVTQSKPYKRTRSIGNFTPDCTSRDYTITFTDIDSGSYYFDVNFVNFYKTKNTYDVDWSLGFYPNDITYTVTTENSSFFKNIQEKLKGWFDNLFGWLKSIVDGITNGFKNVGTWFTNLSNNIKGFFSDLSTNIKGFFSDLTNSVKTLFTNLTTKLTDFNNNIKSWFKNLGDNLSTWFTNLVDNIKAFLSKVGEWFTTLFEKLGNWFSDLFAKLKQWFENVGQWFKDLWNNITNKVTEIRTDLHNWWESLFTPDDGFFEAYKTSFDEFFKQHFGILYQVVDFFRSLFSKMVLMLDGGGSGVIEYGELSLPAKLFGKKLVILNSGTFSFDNLIDSDDSGQLVNISGMIYTVTSVIIYLVLLLRAKKIFEQIITNGEGVED